MNADDRALLASLRRMDGEDSWRSWGEVLVTLALLGAGVIASVQLDVLAIRLALVLPIGVMLLRLFILHHDVMHRALLRDSRIGRGLFRVIGALMLTPTGFWNHNHNHHHAALGRVLDDDVGSYPVHTIDEWRRMNPSERLAYRIVRSPVTAIFGYFTVFAGVFCVFRVLQNPRKYWSGPLILALHLVLHGLVMSYAGFELWLCALTLPMFFALGAATILFFIQHSFAGVRYPTRPEDWSFVSTATHMTAMTEMHPVMHWLTANVGYHHVHHLAPRIPFYKLPRALAGAPALQEVVRVRLRLRDLATCFQQDLLDPATGRMISFTALDSAELVAAESTTGR